MCMQQRSWLIYSADFIIFVNISSLMVYKVFVIRDFGQIFVVFVNLSHQYAVLLCWTFVDLTVGFALLNKQCMHKGCVFLNRKGAKSGTNVNN